MTTHNLFRGGMSTRKNGWSLAMFPSTEPGPDDAMEAASHKGPVDYALTWGFAPGMSCEEAPQRSAFMAQQQYFRELDAEIAVGDVINAVMLPRFSRLIDVLYMNCCPQKGLKANLVVRGNAASLGGTTDTPAPIVLAEIDFGTLTWGKAINLTAFAKTPYFDQNDMLQLVFTAVPAAGIDMNCLRFALSPIVREYFRGDWIECISCCGVKPAVPSPAYGETVVSAAQSSLDLSGTTATATVKSADDTLLANKTVHFYVVSGNATLSAAEVVTGSKGTAAVTITAGASESVVAAVVDGVFIGSITITA